MSSVLVKLPDKVLIIIMGLSRRLNKKRYSLIFLENLHNRCHCCGWLTEFLVFRTALLVEFSVIIRCRYGIDTTSI